MALLFIGAVLRNLPSFGTIWAAHFVDADKVLDHFDGKVERMTKMQYIIDRKLVLSTPFTDIYIYIYIYIYVP